MRTPRTTASGTLRRLLLAGAVLATLALAACSTDADTLSETEGLPSLQTSLEAHTWVLQPSRSMPRIGVGDLPTIAFEADRTHGRAPCNPFRGEVEYGGDDSLTISKLATSLRACLPAAARAERSFLAALGRVDSADVPVDAEDTATLSGKGVRLVFRGMDARDELTRTWHITNVNTGDAIEAVASGIDPTVTFVNEGDLTLHTGCNPVAGSWELDGDRLEIGPLRQGLKACAGPEGELEMQLTRALDAADRVEITPDTLTILDERGRIMVVATTDVSD